VSRLNPRISYEKAAKVPFTAYLRISVLHEAACNLGVLTAEQFDSWVRPQEIAHPLADGQ
jgi:fumarate hydratase, class II